MVVCGTDLLNQYVSFIQNLSDKIKPNINVLGARMMNLVLSQSNRTLTVAVDINMLLINFQIIYQIMKPNSFLKGFCHTAIYSTSVVDKTTVDCKVDRQHTGPPTLVNT